MEDIKHPEVEVQLTGMDGNAYGIIGRTQNALRAAGVSADEVTDYYNEATSGDYDNLLRVTMRWVTVS